MTATIKLWGDSPAVRIPKYILSQANLKEGVDMEIMSTKEGEILLRAIKKRITIEEIFAENDVGFFQTEELDWGIPQGEEVW